MKKIFIGRENSLNEILSFLKESDSSANVLIKSISGPL
jgi:hypothetical protein